MERVQGVTCNPKGLPKGPLTNIEDGLEQSVSEQAKERISTLLETIDSLSDVEKLLLYLKLPTGCATEDVLRQTPTSFLYASNRLEQAQAFTWIRSHLEEDSQICVPKHEVYDDYRSYCDSHGLKALCPADFGKVLKCIFPNVKPRRLGQRGQSRYCYSGLRKKFDIQPPSLPELEISPKKPKTEDLQENELFSASCQLVCEWAGKLLSRGFSSLRELSEFLVGNLYVNSKSTAAFTVLAAMQEAGLHNSRVPVSPLFTCSSGGDKHRETQLQLQRKLQERELLKEQKKKLLQQRSEIEQEQQQLRGGATSRGPSATTPTPTPTKCSPLPLRSFSKTPTPIRSPVLRPPSSSSTLKSPGPTVTFRQTPTPTSGLPRPAKCVSRNITKLLQSPVHSDRPLLLLQSGEIKTEAGLEVATPPGGRGGGNEAETGSAAVSTAMTTSASSSATSCSSEGIASVVEARQGTAVGMAPKPTLMVSSVNGMNLLSRGSHQFIISGSQGLILDNDVFAPSAETTAAIFKNGMHVVQKPVVVPASSSSSASSSQPVTSSSSQLLPGAVATSQLSASVSNLSGSVGNLSSCSAANLCGSVGNVSSSGSSVSSFDSVHQGHSITIVPAATTKEKTSCASAKPADLPECATSAPSAELEQRCRTDNVNFIPGNLSTRSAFVPVSNQKLALTLITPASLGAGGGGGGSVALSEGSSGDESKDNSDDLPVPMDQSETLGSSGGFEPQGLGDSGGHTLPSDPSSLSSNQSSLAMATQLASGQKKVKNRFTPIRPKAPQATANAGFQKDQRTPEKDSRPVCALLKEKRAREAQEVLQHLASSFQSHSSGKAFPSSLSLSAEVLGLSPDKGVAGAAGTSANDVVIILSSPSAGNGAGSKAGSRDLHHPHPTEDKPQSTASKPGSLAFSMSDILIANPNFVPKKDPGTTPASAISSSTQPQISTSATQPQISTSATQPQISTSATQPQISTSVTQPQISISYQPIARQLLTEKQPVSSSAPPPSVAAALLGLQQQSGSQADCDGPEPSNATDEEVTQHMRGLSQHLSGLSSRMVLADSHHPDAPSSRKRKSSGQGGMAHTHKRLNSEKKCGEGEDDDVFIVDDPPVQRSAMESPLPKVPVLDPPVSGGQHHALLRHVVADVTGGQHRAMLRHVLADVAGRVTRSDINASPYLRPGSSTLVDMQVDEPVSSRCLSTGIGTSSNTGAEEAAAVTAQLAAELSRQTRGKLNVESLESDALLDSWMTPTAPTPSVSKQTARNPLLRLPPRGPAVGAGPKVSCGFSAESLAAMQQTLLQEKELLDARFDLFLSKCQEQQSLGDAGAAQHRQEQHQRQLQQQQLQQVVPFPDEASGVKDKDSSEQLASGLVPQRTATSSSPTTTTYRTTAARHGQPPLLVQMHPASQAVQGHLSNPVHAHPGDISRQVYSTGGSNVTHPMNPSEESGDSGQQQADAQALYLQLSSQMAQSLESTVFHKAGGQSGGGGEELCPPSAAGLAPGQGQAGLQDSSLATFQMDENLDTFLDIVQGIVSEQTASSTSTSTSTQLQLQHEHQQQGIKSEVLTLSSTSSKFSLSQHRALSARCSPASKVSLSPSQPQPTTAVPSGKPGPSQQHRHRVKIGGGGGGAQQQPPPNTLLALLQSPVLSAISPPALSVCSANPVSKVSEKSHNTTTVASQQGETTPTRRSSLQKRRSSAVTGLVTASSSSSSSSSSCQQTSSAGSPQQQQQQPAVLGSPPTPPCNVAVMSGSTVTRLGDARNGLPRPAPQSLGSRVSEDNSVLLPGSTSTSLGPVPPSLPANFLDSGTDWSGELPLDVANFVTDYSLRTDFDQDLQPHQQQQGESTVHLGPELQNFLLQNSSSLLVSAGKETGSDVAMELSCVSQKDTFTMPSNPAPKQRLSDSGSSLAGIGAKKYPPVQRSASLPVFVPRGQAPDIARPSSPTGQNPVPSPPTRDACTGPARRARQTASDRSSGSLSDTGYHSFDSPLMVPATALTPLPPTLVSSTPSQDAAAGLASARRNPMLSARSDSAQSVASEGSTVLSLQQGSPQAASSLSNPGSVSAGSPGIDSAAASPSAFMPIQVSPSSSTTPAGGNSVCLGSQQNYVQPVRPLVTLASVTGSGHSPTSGPSLVSSAFSSGGMVSARTLDLLTAAGTDEGSAAGGGGGNVLDLHKLSQLGVGVGGGMMASELSPMDTSPSSVQSVKSDPGSSGVSSVSRLMSASPCPGTVPYSAPSPRRHPAGVSPGPSPTPAAATSTACSPSPSPGAPRASTGQGVLQKLLSRSAPPTYAESVQQRLMAGTGQLAGNQVIGGFVLDHRSSSGNGVRSRAGSTQGRLGSGSTSHTELSGQFMLPMMSVEDVKPPAKSVVHHTPSSSTAASSAGSAQASTVERSGRRIAILKRDSNTKPKSSSSSSSLAQKAASAVSDSILKASLASPPSPLDGSEYSRPYSKKLVFLKQQSEIEGATTATGQVKRSQGATQSVLAASLATLKQGSNPPSPGTGSKGGAGSVSTLGVQVSSPATPGSVSSAPSPASSQGQGQMSVPLRISTSTPSHSSDIFFGLPASSPSPSPRVMNPFSPQQPPSSASSTSSSASNTGALYLPFNLPDMNYMGNAPNIDLSQLMPGSKATPPAASATATAVATVGPPQTLSTPATTPAGADATSNSSELQGLEELHLTLDILRGIDGQYFSSQDVEGEDLMRNVFGELTPDLQASSAVSSQEEDNGDEEEGGSGERGSVTSTSRSRVRESSL